MTWQTVATNRNKYPTICPRCHLAVRPGSCTARVYSEHHGSHWVDCRCADELHTNPDDLGHILEPLPTKPRTPQRTPQRTPRRKR